MSRELIKKLPKISIIVPSFNKVKYISKTFQSIVDQKYPNLEVLIYDGGSTDGTTQVIIKFCQKYPQVFKWVSKKDQGQVDAIVRGLKRAKGEILTFINADDFYKKNALEKVAKVFLESPDCLWITGLGDVIDQNDQVIASPITQYKNSLIKLNKFNFLLMVNYITQPATFISKKAYQKYGPFTGTKNYVMEYEFWLKLGKRQMPVIVPDYLASFRLTTDNISSTSFKKLLDLDNKIAQKYTKNGLLISLHKLHNIGRKIIVSL